MPVIELVFKFIFGDFGDFVVLDFVVVIGSFGSFGNFVVRGMSIHS